MSESTVTTPNEFGGFNLGPSVQRGIVAAGWTTPRPIQSEAIPAVLEGRDVLGLAQTGTGKTAAFALPILERLLGSRGRGPRVLIVAPTRELATQISEEIRMLARYTPIKVVTIFGGVSAGPQTAKLRERPEIVVACPGRLLDLMNQGAVRLNGIQTLVLDEADHMFDMGFLPDIRRILAALPAERQNLLFSATMPREIRRLANGLLHKPLVVELSHSRPASTIEHALYPIDDTRKLALLARVVSKDDFVSAIVFTRTKHRAKKLALQLEKAGHRAVALQGNMSQNARTRAMDGFRKREFDILVATDIAARGLDVEQVSHVINFDMPNTPDAYTHRIGRTGRSEREGQALTFVTRDDLQMVREVEHRIGSSIPRRTMDGIESAPFSTEQLDRPQRRPARAGKSAGGNGSRPRRAPGRNRGGSTQAAGAAKPRRHRAGPRVRKAS